jgi:hypothetical protein
MQVDRAEGGVKGARLPDGFVAPVTNPHVQTTVPDATSLEPANCDAFSPDVTSAHVAQRRQAAWQINPQTGEPKLENLDGDLVGYVERHPLAHYASHRAPIRFESKSASFHQLTPGVLGIDLGHAMSSLPVATAHPLDQPYDWAEDVKKKATCLIDEDSPESVLCIH